MSNIAIQRLYRQQIARSRFKTPAAVVAWMGALQGQDYAGVKWSAGLRVPGSTDAGIEQALIDKTLVRTWAMRGTLQLVAAADVRWLLALLAPRLIAGSARRNRELELDEATFARSNAILADAVQDGRTIARTAVRDLLQSNGISGEGQRAVHMIQRASLDGLICQGVAVRNSATLYALDTLPPAPTLARDQALAELARRYFTSRGPATLQDFVWWSGLAVAEARTGLQAIQAQFVQEDVEGQIYWSPRTRTAFPDHVPGAWLLPGFDEYVLGYADRGAVIDEQHERDLAPGNGIFSSTVVIDGRVVGTWKRTFEKGTVVIAVKPFARLTAAQRDAIATTAQGYGEFLEKKTRVE